MGYKVMEKAEWKTLKSTLLGGADGILYLSPNEENIFKLLYNFYFHQGIEGKKKLLDYLMNQKQLKQIAAIPEDLVFVPHKKRIGFWMTYFKNGVKLDEWTKINKENPKKVLQMYQRISEILKILHQQYGIIISDCYYNNILIVDDEQPIFLDVDSWCIDDITSCSTSNILVAYSRRQLWNRYEQTTYLSDSENADKAALWLMYLEAGLNLPVRNFHLKKFLGYVKKREDVDSIIKEIVASISIPELPDVPYLHEVPILYKKYYK